ncbi:MAG: right-handed parallel beta-helix repeat-containing protein, partial [Candidatus Zixiibacteriota bacterium]
MLGDFSNWRFRKFDNFNGVLHQQGRVLTDVDYTDAERICLHWQGEAARDIIGARVAAVPAADPDGFRIEGARVESVGGKEKVELSVTPGRVWADGLLTYLAGDPDSSKTPVDRRATYYGPPVQSPGYDTTSIGDDVRDAVILELSHEEMNAFQWPERLLEPALGDLDTTERIHTAFAFRLYRLGAGETCRSIISQIQDTDDWKGHLTVTLPPQTTVGGDCPVEQGGGYTGFEHHLYRIEIAHVNEGTEPHFKWSQFNGGLVGRGKFIASDHTCEITGNRPAILNSGLTNFYLEAVELDQSTGRWNVSFGTDATLNAQNVLVLTDPPTCGQFPAGDKSIFIRLWNGIAPISSFTAAGGTVLRDSIHLEFDAPDGVNYRPGDYWTFTVRAGESSGPTLVDDEPPQGIFHHRVSLGEIHWTNDKDTSVSGSISDCRRRFRPLTRQTVCCTLLIGDGICSFGDFNSLEEAAEHLPMTGGQLCLLPGVHYANLSLADRQKITIAGCPKRTMVYPRISKKELPILTLTDCSEITISGLDMVNVDGTVIHARSTTENPVKLRDLIVRDCRILGAVANAIRIDGADGVEISRNTVSLRDTTAASAAISFKADRIRIEDNMITVVPDESLPESPEPDEEGGTTPDPADLCTETDELYTRPRVLVVFAEHIWNYGASEVPINPFKAWGGIHVRSGSEETRIQGNRIIGGAGNGVTLGGELLDDDHPDAQSEGEIQRVPILVRGEEFGATVVDANDNPVADLEFALTNVVTGHANVERTDGAGELIMAVRPPYPHFELSTVPGIRITRVEQLKEGEYYRLVVEEVDADPVETSRLARIFSVTVADNEITQMGLSGIGFGTHAEVSLPKEDLNLSDSNLINELLFQFTAKDLAATSNAVSHLSIVGNRIHQNVRNPFTDEMLRKAGRIALAGISLGMVSNATISKNRIRDNGGLAKDPLCGIFVGYAENLEIGDNVIANNGGTGVDYEDLPDAIRGGIFVRFASVGGIDAETARAPAICVRDNNVDQPVGRALTALCFGPAVCTDNYFNCEYTGRWQRYADLIFGGVLIINVGGLHHSMSRQLDEASEKLAELVLPGGDTMVANNQVRLGPENRSITSVVLGSLDDLGYHGNQSSIFQNHLILSNVVILARTLRATSSRFIERYDRITWSLCSLASESNITATNICDHCLVTNLPDSNHKISENVVLYPSGCGRFEKYEGQVRYLIQVLAQALSGVSIPSEDDFALAVRPQMVSEAAGVSYMVWDRGLTAKRFILVSETNRLAAKYGPDSLRVKELDAQIARSYRLTDTARNVWEA